jgi:hypothetical protein
MNRAIAKGEEINNYLLIGNHINLRGVNVIVIFLYIL